MEKAEEKFVTLKTFIPFLERFLELIKAQADTKEEFAKKYDKAEYLIGILKNGFQRYKNE